MRDPAIGQIELDAAGWQCEVCGADARTAHWQAKGGSLQVHHRTYERLGAELPGDLQVLCPECHRSVHGIDEGNGE